MGGGVAFLVHLYQVKNIFYFVLAFLLHLYQLKIIFFPQFFLSQIKKPTNKKEYLLQLSVIILIHCIVQELNMTGSLSEIGVKSMTPLYKLSFVV